MPPSRALKPLAALAFFIASRNWTRAIIRVALKPFKMKEDRAVSLDGETLYVNSLDRLVAAHLWKRSLLSGHEARIYRDCVKPGMTVLEIGANIGFFTLLFSKLAGETGRVIAFEPDPGNFRLLEKNIKANGRANVTCVKKAVAEKTSALKLFRSEEHHGDHRIFDSTDGRETVEIEAAAIDDFLPEGTAVDFIKMDIQGAEYSALCGMERTIRNSPKLVMVCEFSPALLRQAGAEPAQFLEKIKALDLTLNCLDEERNEIVPSQAPELICKCGAEGYLNLYLVKKPCAE